MGRGQQETEKANLLYGQARGRHAKPQAVTLDGAWLDSHWRYLRTQGAQQIRNPKEIEHINQLVAKAKPSLSFRDSLNRLRLVEDVQSKCGLWPQPLQGPLNQTCDQVEKFLRLAPSARTQSQKTALGVELAKARALIATTRIKLHRQEQETSEAEKRSLASADAAVDYLSLVADPNHNGALAFKHAERCVEQAVISPEAQADFKRQLVRNELTRVRILL